MLLTLLVSSSALSALVVTTTDPINGNSISVWDDYNLIGYDIFATVNTGSGWSAVSVIGNLTTNENNPLSSINSTGNAVVVWAGTNPITGYNSLYGNVRDVTTGLWGLPILLSTANEYVNDDYHVRISNGGKIVTTWSSYDFVTGVNGLYGKTGTFPSFGTTTLITPL